MSVFYLIRYFGVKAPRGFINRDHFSAYLGMVIPLALGFLFVSYHSSSFVHLPRWREAALGERPSFSLRFLLFFCVIVMSAALFFTMSRGGMFSFIAALLFMAILTARKKSIKKRRWILSAAAIFIVLTITWLGATPVIERILSIKVEIASRYFGGRLPIWQGTLRIIKDYPLFGTGLGTFNYIFPGYQPLAIMSAHYAYAHSDILELLSETGIIFFSLSMVYGLWCIAWLFRRFSRRYNPWVIGMSISLFGSLVSIFFHSFTDFNLHMPANAILFILILVVTLITLNMKEDRFGERVNLKKTYFLFSKRSAVRENIFQNILREIFRVSLYPFISIVFGFYIFIAVRPALADYYFRKAKVDKRNTHDARRDMQYAIRLDPTNALYHYHLGKLYSKQAKDDEHLASSIEHLVSSIKLNPTNSKYHQSLAWTYGQLADLPQTSDIRPQTSDKKQTTNYRRKAIDEFKLAISLEPNNAYRHRAYAIWLFNHPTKENIKEGLAQYKEAVKLNSSLAKEVEKYMAKYARQTK
ncbi:MAG: O-antigen ligase family protein [Candidatus Omnitrophica bacterium]|nr:O-antigen ligase family protein [Candidatus Omnitrophota bacterium]